MIKQYFGYVIFSLLLQKVRKQGTHFEVRQVRINPCLYQQAIAECFPKVMD